MAEVLLRMALPPRSSWCVASAGLAVCQGGRASEAASSAIAEVGGDLSRHRSRPVTEELVQEAAAIIAMTSDHAQQLITRYPSVRDKLFLLRSFDPHSPAQSNIADPFCGSLADYRECRDLIRQAIPGLADYLTQADQTVR